MKYLAIDYGTVRVGVAVSRLFLAEPWVVLDRKDAIEKLIALIADEQPDALVLGIADGPMVGEGRAFVKELNSKLKKPLQIIEADETLSSVESQQKMLQSGMSKMKRRQPMDHYAAAAFLQNYLDTQKEE
ncbi:MAG TPA: Holliday junction resolvase RuvX [Patescibacteria group bacterium]|nr:Holliday junction resolvase RuvX [Patescibacteria group bacterium]